MMSGEFNPNKEFLQAGKKRQTTTKANEPIPHVTGPDGAVFVQRALGQTGDKVAIAGFSVSGFGLFASCEQGTALFATGATFAAELEGNVRIAGALQSSGDYDCGGNIHVHGDITLLGADYAEDFDVADSVLAEPGTVMVLDDSGGVRVSDTPYDRRVAGVVSGAGGYRPALILDSQPGAVGRRPLALMGKVFCKADASLGAIGVGDMLTTSSTPGHAMKADDATLAFGAVIGKALRPLASGQGLVPILVTLQ
jgi:hypothetical protein